MKRVTTKLKMWGLGIDADDAAIIEQASGNEFELIMLPVGTLPSAEDMDIDQPCLAWISREGWDAILNITDQHTQHLDIIPRVLLLGGDYTLEELEEAIDSGFTDVIKPPLTELRVKDVLLKAVETQTLYQDIMKMTREICLERELLTRKNDILSFIVSFVARAAESLDPLEILQRAQEDLATLIPIHAVSATCWSNRAGEPIEANLFLSAAEHDPTHAEWVELMLGSAEKLAQSPVSGYQVSYLRPVNRNKSLMPEAGKVVILPLKAGGEAIGTIGMLADEELNLGKDQVQILQSAMQHLGLALRNAMMFREVQQHADYDGLTHVHNRRHFEGKLREELDRHSRYNHPLTMMMLDIDYFKRINDTYGHQAGDAVLKELSSTLRNTLRSTDYVARYGGEEFVVILPHTTEKQGYKLAERFREKIASKPFIFENIAINATISIGLTALKPTALGKNSELVKEADQALYFAKANGRNLVCTFKDCSPEQKVENG